MTIAAGIDVGTGAVKAALFRVEGGQDGVAVARGDAHPAARPDGARARSPSTRCSPTPSSSESDVDYVATTGEGEGVPFHTGHFYSMTTHARGAIYLDPGRARGARRRRAARPRHLDRRARQGAELQDDQPVRVGLRPVPGEHRALSRHRARTRSARSRARPTIPRWCRQHLRRAGRDRRDQHGLARHFRRRTSSKASTCRWRAGCRSS